jgi:hypothetical protein
MQLRAVDRRDDCNGEEAVARAGNGIGVCVGSPGGMPQGTRLRQRRSGRKERRFGVSALTGGAGALCGSGLLFAESVIESLVRSVGWRRLRRFAGRLGAANVAFRGITPDPTTAIQAVAGSGVDAGQAEGVARSRKTSFGSRTLEARERCSGIAAVGIASRARVPNGYMRTRKPQHPRTAPKLNRL